MRDIDVARGRVLLDLLQHRVHDDPHELGVARAQLRTPTAFLQLALTVDEREVLRVLLAPLCRRHKISDVMAHETIPRSPAELRIIADRVDAQARREIRVAAHLTVIRPPKCERRIHHANAQRNLPLRGVRGKVGVVECQKSRAAQFFKEFINAVERSPRSAAINGNRIRRDANAEGLLAQSEAVRRLTGTQHRIRANEDRAGWSVGNLCQGKFRANHFSEQSLELSGGVLLGMCGVGGADNLPGGHCPRGNTLRTRRHGG